MSIEIKNNIPLSRYTTFKIGGPAKYFCEVRSEQDLEEAIKFAKEKKIAAFIMGGGSNLLINDKGFDGLVIKIASLAEGSRPKVKMKMENGNFFIECWVGESMVSLVSLAAESSLTGLEWAAGLPGSLGGAIRGNAGAFGPSTGDMIERVRIMDLTDFRYKDFSQDQCEFSYRNSIFKKNDNLVVVSATMKFQKGNKQEIEAKTKEILSKRKMVQPQNHFSAGSFFKNPVVNNVDLIQKFENDTNTKCQNNKIPAGWLIAEAGLQNKKIGEIQVSGKHSNFIVNLGGGKAEDVVMLVSIIKQKVRDEFEIELEEEVKFVGF